MIIDFFINAYNEMIDSFIHNPLAQAIGCAALILSLISFQMSTRGRILFFQMLASLSCAVSLVMLGGIFMAALTLFQHRSNIVRLIKGEERKTNLFKKGGNQ
jgi:glycerol-3-phosphate acyltransferase PlsY